MRKRQRLVAENLTDVLCACGEDALLSRLLQDWCVALSSSFP